jgi:tetratricopeptide (TPR) repeat protein
MMLKHTTWKVLILATFLFGQSCGEDFLDKKSNKALVIPQTLSDFQSLLDNAAQVMNIVPGIGLISSDESFMDDQRLRGLQPTERHCYTWEKAVYGSEQVSDWNILYQQIFYANVVLEGLNHYTAQPGEQALWNTLYGTALFTRAHALHQLLIYFSPPYDAETATTALGVPIRRKADVNEPIRRATLQDSYEALIRDLEESLHYLPTSVVMKTRPSLPAAHALLARTYLMMGLYNQALEHANEAWNLTPLLLDYNDLNGASAAPIPFNNVEVLYYASLITYSYVISTGTYIDTVLVASYDDADLRKTMFFDFINPKRCFFKGSYTGSWQVFGGLSTNEVFFMRAECNARLGNEMEALADLNYILQKRWQLGAYTPYTETNTEALLALILQERQKELIFRNNRWMDLRRLNTDPRFARTLTRTVEGITYTLPPGDLRYTFPIPQAEIKTSGIEQNLRE